MVKWADYLITKVGYDSEHTHIVKVESREDKGEKVGSPFQETRQTVVANLKKGVTYCTAKKGSDNKWQKGAMVGIVTVRGTEYIRTDQNATESDNLGSLPEF